VHPREVADALVEKRCLRRPEEIRINLLAYAEGALVRCGDTGRSDAFVARSGDRAVITLPPRDWGTPRGRFSIAHELAHLLLHPDADAVARIHGEPRKEAKEHAWERCANEFARHLLVPRVIAAPMCEHDVAELRCVRALARAFDVSLSVAARRYAELSLAPCAFVEAKRGRIQWATRSRAFRGEAVQRRPLPDGALALDRLCGWALGERTRTHRTAWGAAFAGAEIVEDCVRIGDDGGMLVWLRHA
jgi:Zn-dependent peptidase ImmA (M78 family)